jgi:CHAT domain-containing protein/tetratricopeptide (TPR) repeat protein
MLHRMKTWARFGKWFVCALMLCLLMPTLPGLPSSPTTIQPNDIQTLDAGKPRSHQLFNVGLQQFQTSQFQAALASWRQVLDMARATGDRALEANTLGNLGLAYTALGEYPQALEVQQQALTLARTLGMRSLEASTLGNLGSIYIGLGQYSQAIEVYQQQLAVARELGDHRGQASALGNLGSARYGLREYADATTLHQQALSLGQTLGDRTLIANAISNLGIVAFAQGDYPASVAWYEQALPLFEALSDRRGQANLLSALGNTAQAMGHYGKAIDYYQQGLELAQTIGDRNLIASITGNLGNIHIALGDYQQAVEVYQQQLHEAQALGDRQNQANMLGNLGNAQVYLQRYSQAINAYQQQLALTQQLGDRLGEAYALNGLGESFRKLMRYSQAVDHYQQALQIAQEIGDRAGEATILGNLGLAYGALHQAQEAYRYHQQALILKREIGDRPGEAVTLSEIGQLLATQHRSTLAIVFYKQSINITEAIRQDIRGLSQQIQQSYIASISENYRQLADLLLQQNRIIEAQQVLDLLKVQELNDYLHDVRGNGQTAQGIAFQQAEQRILALYDQAIAQGQELAELRQIPEASRTPEQQQRLVELIARQRDITLSFFDFLDRPDILEAVNQLTLTTRRQNLDLQQLNSLQDNLKNLQDAVLLYPLILPDRLELILVTPYAPPIRRTVFVSRDELNQAILNLGSLLINRRRRPFAEAQQLYEWLIKPIEPDLAAAGAKTILYAPDGQLRYIPLAALHDGQRWLVERFAINYITAASLTNFDRPPAGAMRVLAGAFTEGSVSVEVGTREMTFSGLPFAGIEVQNIAATIANTTELFNQRFNRSAVEPRLNEYNVVHFATHAEFVSGQPEESFILFGDGDRVTLRDVSTWSMQNVDLVVLSACKTAVGSELGNGEEVLGFGYQVQRTGARSAIASLWSVDDGSTQVLMTIFYNALKQGMTKSAALQAAQVAMITGDLSHVELGQDDRLAYLTQVHDRPYYWAPFILIGNGL